MRLNTRNVELHGYNFIGFEDAGRSQCQTASTDIHHRRRYCVITHTMNLHESMYRVPKIAAVLAFHLWDSRFNEWPKAGFVNGLAHHKLSTGIERGAYRGRPVHNHEDDGLLPVGLGLTHLGDDFWTARYSITVNHKSIKVAAVGKIQGTDHILSDLKIHLVNRQARLQGSEHRGITRH